MHMFYCVTSKYNRLLQIFSATLLPNIIKIAQHVT